MQRSTLVRNSNVSESDDFLERIARHLVMHASFVPDIGLYHGKMGIALFFVHYARYTGNMLYDDFAVELLNEINRQIHPDIPFTFESGMCGIGWGIDYLLENKFMAGNPNEILVEIDEKIMELNLKRINDFSLKTGLAGILLYIKKRTQSFSSGRQFCIFDELSLNDIREVEKKAEKLPSNPLTMIIRGQYPDNDHITAWQLGLEGGCAGFGLNTIVT